MVPQKGKKAQLYEIILYLNEKCLSLHCILKVLLIYLHIPHITKLSTISWDYTNQKHISKEGPSYRHAIQRHFSSDVISCSFFCFAQRRQNAGRSQLHSSVSIKIIGHFLPDFRCSFDVKNHYCFVFLEKPVWMVSSDNCTNCKLTANLSENTIQIKFCAQVLSAKAV